MLSPDYPSRARQRWRRATSKWLIKAIAMVYFSIRLGLIGTDVNSGVIRLAFGQPELADGLGFVALAMAFFGVTAGR